MPRCSRARTASPRRRRRWARSSPSSSGASKRVAAQIEASEYLAKFSGATGTWSAHLAADPGRRLARAVARVHRAAGPRLQPAHDPDRVARLAGRALRPGPARRRHPAQPGDRRLDLHLPRATSRRSPSPGATGSSTMPHKINPIRFENAEANLETLGRPALDLARLDARDLAACSATSPTRRRSATSGSPSGTRCSRSTTCSAGSARSRSPSPCWLADLDANWEVLGRGDPDRGARRDRRGSLADHRPVRAAQGPHPRSPCRRGRTGRVRRGPRHRGCREAASARADPRAPTPVWPSTLAAGPICGRPDRPGRPSTTAAAPRIGVVRSSSSGISTGRSMGFWTCAGSTASMSSRAPAAPR